jgi:quercetin dioxygenase-like cupin family protein
MDTTVKKIDSHASPHGGMGQTYLASGKRLSMRLWENEAPSSQKPPRARPYETIGYVIAGKARLHLGDQQVTLQPGDSWVVPADAEHTYEILEPFTAVEATSPPARVSERDAPVE